jgi:hypothetical protein
MARVTYGPEVTELAGSIGGVTFQKNASGNVARLRPNPTVNPTSLQAGYQTNMAYLVSFWPTLSQANKDLWDAFALAHDHTTPWGEIKTLSGYQWFLSVNLNRLVEITTPLPSPPAWTAHPPPTAFLLSHTDAAFYITFTPALTFPDDLAIYMSLPLRQSSLKLRRSLFYSHYLHDQTDLLYHSLRIPFENLANVTWTDFWNSADCSIIVRLKYGSFATGLFSSFTSAIVKIN